MALHLSKRDAKALMARNATGACTPTSMAAWVDGCLVLELPHPPSGNKRTTHYRGRTISTREWRAYKRNVTAVVSSNILWATSDKAFAMQRLAVEIDWYPPDNRRRDCGNIEKAVSDALTDAGVWADDSQIDLLTIRRCPVEPGGRVVVRIKERT